MKNKMDIQEIVGLTIKQWVDGWGYEAPEFTDIARFCDLLVRNYSRAEMNKATEKTNGQSNKPR